MDSKMMLMIPGPTPVPEPVLQAMAKHPIGHRTGEFGQILMAVTADLQWLHQTQNDVYMLPASGTGAMEAGIINFFSPGDRVIACENGKFGDRWIKLAKAYGLTVDEIHVEWGQILDPAVIQEKLEADTEKQIKGVIFTHSETSTGVLNDLEAINRVVKAHGEALIIVDVVTSMGAMNIPMDEWGIDVLASGSQKGFMIPPGLGFVAVSPKAWKAYETATLPKFYFDLGSYRKNLAKQLTPFTPPVNLVIALQTALQMMRKEGLESIFARHDRLKTIARVVFQTMGMTLFAPDSHASPAVTAVEAPPGIDIEQVRNILKKQFDIAVTGGQDHLKGKIMRMGHLGFVNERDILTVLVATEAALLQLGHKTTTGAGVAAAIQALSAQ